MHTDDNPIDAAVDRLIDWATQRDRGFTLNLAKDGADKTVIEVVESLAPLDEYEGPADWRAHGIADAASFVAYAQRYGKPDKSLVFVTDEMITLTIDEEIEKGEREVIVMARRMSVDWSDWSKIQREPLTHRDLLRFLITHEHNLANGDILDQLRLLRMTSTVRHDSEIDHGRETVGVLINTGGGEEMAKFDRVLSIRLPVLEQDVTDEGDWLYAEVKIDIELPKAAEGPPLFILTCSLWRTVWVQRLEREGKAIAEKLGDGWLVVHGKHNTERRRLGRPTANS